MIGFNKNIILLLIIFTIVSAVVINRFSSSGPKEYEESEYIHELRKELRKIDQQISEKNVLIKALEIRISERDSMIYFISESLENRGDTIIEVINSHFIEKSEFERNAIIHETLANLPLYNNN